MKASEAFKQSSKIDKFEVSYQDLMQRINDSVKKGYLTLVVRNDEATKFKERLESDGYAIKDIHNCYPVSKTHKVVSWENPTK